ncbi:MAG: hypothetical protein WDN06_14050 [Asticcacaulis sp.]
MRKFLYVTMMAAGLVLSGAAHADGASGDIPVASASLLTEAEQQKLQAANLAKLMASLHPQTGTSS